MRKNKPPELALYEFDGIFERLYHPLCLYAHGYVRDLGLCEDIVQGVFLKVWEERSSFRGKEMTDGLFYTAVRNRSLDHLRSKRARDVRAYPLEDLEALQGESDFISETIMTNTSEIVERAIGSLPDKCAEVIRSGMGGLTNREIAGEMGISVHTVKEYKKIAYGKLRKILVHLKIK
ncbi:sigma-70 family RNA polymerase sigma factor [Flavivirga spongiicola]|uniref:Sigma-70 family RNA polymerase sigma factor n=1 Tax=Flavivirga spongiicola TaxID=421621 RepID=A0ABU7XZ25_9FLAO|nr:sigma-70 family RNA polymerase sigma factor [Flavivirga sp. MEBiC05379]MDO5981029.1 sigma-70 family RNA polymerase sigma factor [Flavivirga sp. MEBiC05379]MDO5981462.1 sigma-70 family RNA polymerase sigma factor [Flavivirga sp. MEBiC05379]